MNLPSLPATATATASVPATPAPLAANTDFVSTLHAAGRSTGWAQMMIGSDWYGPGDTSVAMDATRNAIAAVDLALRSDVAPSGHRTPNAALEAARDGKAFLTRAYEIMEAEDFAPPVQARAFLSAAQRSFSTAISEYRARLEPTPRYR